MSQDIIPTVPPGGQPAPAPLPIFTLWGNIGINLPILAAFIGFVFASFLLTLKGCSNNYNDLVLKNKRDIVNSILKERIAALKNKAVLVQADIDKFAHKAGENATTLPTEKLQIAADKKASEDELAAIKAKLVESMKEQDHLNYFNADTTMRYYAGYFSPDKKAFDSSIKELQKNGSVIVPVLTEDIYPVAYDSVVYGNASLVIQKQENTLLEYVDKNPVMGFWLTLSIAQMAFWFLAMILVTGIGVGVNDIAERLSYNFKNAFLLSLLPLGVMGCFAWLFYWKMIDSYVIGDYFFLGGFNTKMLVYAVPGYIAAALCFGCYLFLSNKLELLNADFKSSSQDDNTKALYAKQYKKLKSSFDLSFIFSSLILSIFVLWLGVLFNAVNNIEAFSYQQATAWKPFISYNLVYLVGLIHTLLLLIFYIPARIRFNSLEIKKEDDAKIAEDTGPAKKLLAFVWESLGTILVTTSPLITSLLQKLITSLTQ